MAVRKQRRLNNGQFRRRAAWVGIMCAWLALALAARNAQRTGFNELSPLIPNWVYLLPEMLDYRQKQFGDHLYRRRKRAGQNGKKKKKRNEMHRPRIERGPHRWQRWILPLDQSCICRRPPSDVIRPWTSGDAIFCFIVLLEFAHGLRHYDRRRWKKPTRIGTKYFRCKENDMLLRIVTSSRCVSRMV